MTGPLASFSTVDLSRLPAPALVERLTYDECYAALLADFRARNPEFDALLPSDPAIKVLEVAAYRETLVRAALNDAGRAVMLPFAGGADLDNLAALYGLTRLVVMPATDAAPAVNEPDADLRQRVQLAPELLAGPGITGGGYRAAALTVAPSIKDVGLIKREGGRIDVVLLGRDGDGTVPGDVVATVAALFAGDDATQVTDIITVRPATIRRYSATITVQIHPGPDPQLVRGAAEAGVRAYAAQRHRVGAPVYAQMLAAAASVGPVEHALVDIGDIVPAADEAAWLEQLTITVQVLA